MIVIVTTGASCVGELLKVNNSLQELVMWDNQIGDDGMSSVADGLQCNNTLTKLDVWECGFSVKGTVVYNTLFKNNSAIHCNSDICQIKLHGACTGQHYKYIVGYSNMLDIAQQYYVRYTPVGLFDVLMQ